MFLGHFAMGAAAKPVAPDVPAWVLILAPQALDIAFLPLVAVGLEGFEPGPAYGQDHISAFYTHSLVGALLISAIMFWIGKKVWRTNFHGWLLGGLSFSHWPVDLLVHHQDMPVLPGNLGGLPLLGFGLWDYAYLIFSIEVILAVIGAVVYFNWANKARPTPRWYVGPAIVALLFAALMISDVPRLSPL